MPETNNTNQIIIKKSYFDNIKTSIDSLNSFFSSNFRDKNFPVLDDDFQVDGTIMTILSWLHNVEPAWIDDPSKVESVVGTLNEMAENSSGDLYTQLLDRNDKVALDHINAFVGYKALQFIADNFTAFSDFVNAIYTFELFTNPSRYSEVIEIFSQHIPIDEIEDVMGENTYTIFDVTKYVTGVFNNDQITLPKEMNLDTEINRVTNGTDLTGFEILVDESVQEAAEVNYFENTKPKHIKYDEKKGKWMISKQFEKAVNDLVAGLRKCDTTEDLKDLFGNNKPGIPEPDKFTNVVFPCILVRAYSNPNKYMNENYDKDLMNNYTKSYDSITDKNMGAKRFKNYDLFSTFKADKDGTLKFLEDFLKLNLVNDERCVIQNNTLLTLFNIFDSRIYLDILYNVLPDDTKKEYGSEDAFVKAMRSRINKNSRAVNVYKADSNPSEGNETATSAKVMEYADCCLTELGDMSITDMQYCEQFHSALMSEIQCLGDVMYNKGTSQITIDHYIGESYNVFGEGFFSSIFGGKKNNPIKKEHTLAELEAMYGTSFPSDFVKGVTSNETYIKLCKMNESVKITIGSETHEITRFCTPSQIYDWNSELAEEGIKYVTFANIGDDDIGVNIDEGTYHIVYGVNEASKPFAKSFDEFLSKLDIGSDKVQESYVQEQEIGDIPDYMRNRINLSDEAGTSPNVTTTDIQLPPDTPTNPISDLATSIDARMQAGGGLDDMLGAGYNDNPHKNHQDGKIVYNITNNYNNSFNRDSNNTNTTTNTDSSTGKTTTTTTTNTNSNNDKSTGKTVTSNSDSSTRKSVNTDNKGGNNNNNSNHSGDTKDSDTAKLDNSQTFSNGRTVQEVFAFLESEEPLSSGKGAGQPPKGDLLTTAMDADRETLSAQQNAKRRVQKAVNTGKALLKPITRTKQWLTKIVDSLIKRDEDKVKAEIIENPSYRTALYKAMRLAMKFGLTGICFTINGYLGAAYLVIQGAKLADKARLRKEVQEEFAAELEILEDKIRATENDPSPEARKARWQMMRLRSKMKRMVAQSPRSAVKNPRYVI